MTSSTDQLKSDIHIGVKTISLSITWRHIPLITVWQQTNKQPHHAIKTHTHTHTVITTIRPFTYVSFPLHFIHSLHCIQVRFSSGVRYSFTAIIILLPPSIPSSTVSPSHITPPNLQSPTATLHKPFSSSPSHPTPDQSSFPTLPLHLWSTNPSFLPFPVYISPPRSPPSDSPATHPVSRPHHSHLSPQLSYNLPVSRADHHYKFG